tara:strand:+ start:5675 stop:6172 length:498 start_codon:yes stop_codon:yes gene_type:complete
MATNKFRMSASFTPIVILPADADADTTEVIHHDVKKTLGSHVEVDDDALSGTQRWWYGVKDIGASDTATIGSGAYTDGTAFSTSDKIQVVYLHHQGIDDTGAATSSKLYIVSDGGANPTTQADALVLRPHGSIVLSYEEVTTANLLARSSSGEIMVEVCALVTDV